MNTKTFKVTTEIKIRRPVWRFLGLGDQPSKAEVADFFGKLLEEAHTVDTEPSISVTYKGSPGYYLVEASFTEGQPFWRRMGFGDTTSKREVKWFFVDKIATIAQMESITVEIVK